jgi:hypothetical protein
VELLARSEEGLSSFSGSRCAGGTPPRAP